MPNGRLVGLSVRIFFAVGLLIAGLTSASAVTFTVNFAADVADVAAGNGVCEVLNGSNLCTLRAAITEANASPTDDVIVFDPSITTIPVRAGELLITNNGSLTIEGTGANVLTLSALQSGTSFGTYVSANRIFNISRANVTIRNIRLLGGRDSANCDRICTETNCVAVGGGSIIISGGSMLLDTVIVTGAKNWVRGGAITMSGFAGDANSYRIINSTIYQNQARGPKAEGGGIYMTGANSSRLYISNSTITENIAFATGTDSLGDGNLLYFGLGGGILSLTGEVTVRNSTIAGNQLLRGTGGGAGTMTALDGIEFVANTFTVGNSILGLGGSTATSRNFIGVNSLGNNLVTGTYVGNPWLASDIVNLGNGGQIFGAANWGGTTPTVYFTSPATSLARNAGSNALAVDPFDNSPLLRDQRGAARIFGGTVDIGAVEIYDSITVAAASLPHAQINVPYSATIQPTSGIAPFTFALDSGSTLPPNLLLNPMTGEISGTPIVSGAFNFTILVTDANATQSRLQGKPGQQQFVGTNLNFQLMILAPTAASVSVSGKALRGKSAGIGNVKIVLTDTNGVARTTFTGQLGFYHFNDVQVGRTYVLSAAHGRYQFDPQAQVLDVVSEVGNANFVAGPGNSRTANRSSFTVVRGKRRR
jgi:hypothetical protein